MLYFNSFYDMLSFKEQLNTLFEVEHGPFTYKIASKSNVQPQPLTPHWVPHDH